MDMMPLEEDFSKFSFLDLSCGAGQLLYTAMLAPYAREMRYFVGGVNLPSQLGSAKRLASTIYAERIEDTALVEIFTKKLLLVDRQEVYHSLNPFTHIFIDTRFTDIGWIQSIAESINKSGSVRFLMINLGEVDLRRHGFCNFTFRASVDVRVTDRAERVTYLLYERKNSFSKGPIGRLKRDPLFAKGMKLWNSKNRLWFE
tara:strand:+ start:1496 stop:2098 length:603 start_codon:yes stop_codon:yes gene_type:complete